MEDRTGWKEGLKQTIQAILVRVARYSGLSFSSITITTAGPSVLPDIIERTTEPFIDISSFVGNSVADAILV